MEQPSGPYVSPITVGRAREIAVIEDRLARGGSALLVAGEAGIGKSRLVREARAIAEQRGYLALQGNCFESDQTLPYAPILDLLRSLLDRRPAAEIARIAGPSAATVARLLPELAAALPEAQPPSALGEEGERRLVRALVDLISRLSDEAPVLVVLEDLHWSDNGSLEIARHLARIARSRPVALVLTYRTDDMQPTLAHLLAELDRERLATELTAAGYLTYDPDSGRYALPPEHAVALTDEASPFFVAGGFAVVTAMTKAEARIAEAFRTGGGLPWGEHDPGLFSGTERLFRPGYAAHLITSWIPALDGVEAKLQAGGTVADVGCGHGASTVVMARAYPNSRFLGFDSHVPSIERARRAAAEAGVADRAIFEVADAASFPGGGYDLIAYFDCLHDLGDPVGAARHARAALAPDGAVLIVEPMAGERVEENLNPLGALFAGASVLCCVPNALASGGPDSPALGTIATEQRLREVVAAGGFTRFRRAAETPFNRIFEARP